MRYQELVRRNEGFVQEALQERIRGTRLLIAGCGLGSVAAEIALRTGFERLILIDGDRVEAHNLNRQVYVASDVGHPKVDALARRLRSVYPAAHIESQDTWVREETVLDQVSRADIVLDTIDFLDLPAILSLHDAARLQGKPVLSGFAAGWGAAVLAFLPGGFSLRELFGLPREGSPDGLSYRDHFVPCFERLASRLPREAVAVMAEVVERMADGKPCPGPQLAVGTSTAGALLVTLAVRLLANLPVTCAPDLTVVDLAGISE